MFANIWIIYQATGERELQKAWFSFPLNPCRVTAIHPIYYKFIAATPGISLKGPLNFNWNGKVKTLSSFLKDKTMHLWGLGASPNSCHHIKSLIPKHKCLGTILWKCKQFEWQMQNYTIGGKRLSSQNIESNDSF